MSVTALAEPPASPLAGRRLLFISNGYGEDSIAAEIIKRLPEKLHHRGLSDARLGQLLPGRLPDRRPARGPRQRRVARPSGHHSPRHRRPAASVPCAPGLAFLRRIANHYDRVIVVGDLIGVVGCWLTGIRKIVYLDVYKTGVRRYSPIERMIIKQTAAIVFNRSEALAEQLRAAGIDARFAGNVMMDTVSYGEYDVAARRRNCRPPSRCCPAAARPSSATSSPSSRASGCSPTSACPTSSSPSPTASIPTISPKRGAFAYVGPMTSEAGDLGTLRDERLTIHLTRGVVGNLLEGTDVVLSQAGTATIQAIGMGRPVITFNSASDRPKRVRDEQKLFGEAWMRVPGNPGPISRALTRLLRDTARPRPPRQDRQASASAAPARWPRSSKS